MLGTKDSALPPKLPTDIAADHSMRDKGRRPSGSSPNAGKAEACAPAAGFPPSPALFAQGRAHVFFHTLIELMPLYRAPLQFASKISTRGGQSYLHCQSPCFIYFSNHNINCDWKSSFRIMYFRRTTPKRKTSINRTDKRNAMYYAASSV